MSDFVQPRQNMIILAVGDRGSGKTPYIIGDEQYQVTGMIDAGKYLERGMKVLIVDTFDHPKYRRAGIKQIQPEQIKVWKKGVYRMFGSDFDAMFESINTSLYNALLVYEDAYKYVPQKLPKPFVSFLIDTKQKNVDIIFLYHAWGFIPKDLFRLVDAFEIFKSEEHPLVRKTELSGCYERVVKVYERVMKHPSKYYHESLLR